MARSRRLNQSKLDEHLAALGQEAITIDDGGDPISREEMLARRLWDRALGWTEKVKRTDDFGNTGTAEIEHPPERWAMEYLWDRREGRVAQATPKTDDTGRLSAAEKVRELAKERLNRLAVAGKPATRPPKYRPDVE